MSTAVWSDDRVERLKTLFEAGLSMSQIAAELGNGVSRNAVIGKVNRLGLQPRGWGNKPKSSVKAEPAARQAPSRILRGIAGERERRKCAAIAQEFDPAGDADSSIPVPAEQRVSLDGLTADNCHWPVGDPHSQDFYFCGGNALSGQPYCARHSRVAYQPAVDRRRAPPRGARA